MTQRPIKFRAWNKHIKAIDNCTCDLGWEEKFDEWLENLVKITAWNKETVGDKAEILEILWKTILQEKIGESIKSFIRENFIPRERVEEVIEEMKNDPYEHGAYEGNGYRQALSDLRQELLGKEEKK